MTLAGPLTQAEFERMSPEDQAKLRHLFPQPKEDKKDKHYGRRFGATRNGQPWREQSQ